MHFLLYFALLWSSNLYHFIGNNLQNPAPSAGANAVDVLPLANVDTNKDFDEFRLDEFPENLQLYGRDLATSTAQIAVNGTLATQGDSVTLVILRNGAAYAQLGYKASTTAAFSFSPTITAELANYTFELYVRNQNGTQLMQRADGVVAGDVYIINGQSNAEAEAFYGSSEDERNDFIRVYALGTNNIDRLVANLEWGIAQGDGNRHSYFNTGQWGLYLARQIVDNQGIPVAIFNGAQGGLRIKNFKKYPSSPENLSVNYGRLLFRLNRTKLADKVRAIFWYQGEEDVDNTSAASYMTQFETLYNHWQTDFPALEHLYITEIRTGYTTTPAGSVVIQDALRQLANHLPKTTIMSAKGLLQFELSHFGYQYGYKELGKRYYRLINQDLYGNSTAGIQAPNIDSITFTASDEITIFVQQPDTLIWEMGSEADFIIEGTTASVTGGYTDQNTVVLQLSEKATTAEGLTYLDKSGNNIIGPYIINERGYGLVSFYNVPIQLNNQPPIATADAASLPENTAWLGTILQNDTDPEGDDISLNTTPIVPPSHGTLTLGSDGIYSYFPDTGFSGVDSFTYEICDNGTPSMCSEAIVTLTITKSCMDFDLKVNLEGAYNPITAQMSNHLNSRGLLPGQTPVSQIVSPTPPSNPYQAAPWNFPNTEGFNWSNTEYATTAVDWLLVSFRKGLEKDTEVLQTIALLHQDGYLEFTNPCILPSNDTTPYYIVIEHRNHVGIMSIVPISATNGVISFNFTLSDSYRDATSFGQKMMPDGTWAMIAGDGDPFDFPSYDITGADKNIWAENNGTFDQYTAPDFNLDGDINGADKNIWSDNNGISSRVPR